MDIMIISMSYFPVLAIFWFLFIHVKFFSLIKQHRALVFCYRSFNMRNIFSKLVIIYLFLMYSLWLLKFFNATSMIDYIWFNNVAVLFIVLILPSPTIAISDNGVINMNQFYDWGKISDISISKQDFYGRLKGNIEIKKINYSKSMGGAIISEEAELQKIINQIKKCPVSVRIINSEE